MRASFGVNSWMTRSADFTLRQRLEGDEHARGVQATAAAGEAGQVATSLSARTILIICCNRWFIA